MNAPTAVSQRRRKRMRTQTRSTPWKDSFELNAIGRALLLAAKLQSPQGIMTPALLSEAEQADLHNALFRVNMWKARSDQGRIPHSMETTFALAQVAWRDATDGTNVSSLELRMAYSTALLRGVNGLADALQQNRAYAASVASLCEQMGLPGWLVDIRHEAAHNDLPSLSVLRLATKTFLGYLQERYWEPLTNARCEARETAVQLLVKYKETCKKTATTTGSESKKEAPDDEVSASDSSSDDSETDGDTNDDTTWGKSVGTSQNRFSAFLDTPAKPKKKRKKEVLKNDGEKQAQNAVHSALHFARAFVKDTPIDVGYQVALSFLVWGGIGDAPSGRGVLIPGSPVSFPASEEGIQRIRHRYSPLLRVLCKAWPGFVYALLVHLVDHVISIERSSAGNELDAGSERKLYFLVSWIRFLLSRRFHMHHDDTVARYGKQKQDLSKKAPAKWTKAERDFMESTAPCSVLLQAGLPLNSLCDRCIGSGRPDLTNGIHALGVMFTDILGDQRVSNYGIAITNDVRPQKPEPSADSVEAKAACALSLDEMEMMLDSGATESTTETAKSNSNSNSGREETAVASSTGVKASAWSLCETWDPCAIGTLAGDPV